MKYIVLFALLFLLGCSTDQKAISDGKRAPTAESGKTVPATEVAEVVKKLVSLDGTEAKIDAVANSTVKEFNGKHAGDRVVLKFGIWDIRADGTSYQLSLSRNELPQAFFDDDHELSSGGDFLGGCRMSLTEQEALTIEKPKDMTKATSFVEVSGMCRLAYGCNRQEALPSLGTNSTPSLLESGKDGIVGHWTAPCRNHPGKPLYLVLENVKTKLILPAR
jgi:hypothetical protein